MQSATILDPLTDVAPLLEMALAAEARLRPLILSETPPGDAGDDPVPHLNRVTLILGRMVQIRKALRALRDGGESPRAPRQPRRAAPLPTEPDHHSTESIDATSPAASLLTRIAAVNSLIDAVEAPVRGPDRNAADSPILYPFGRNPVASREAIASQGEPNNPIHVLGQKLPSAPAETNPVIPEPQTDSPTPLIFPLNSPAQTQAIAEKLNRALRRLASQSRRILPAAIPASPFNITDLAPAAARTHLSPALLKNILNPDTS